MSLRALGRLTLVALVVVVTVACAPRIAAVTPGPAMPARDTVVISDAPYGAAHVGTPITLAARVWRDGVVVPDAAVEWSASPASLARLGANGMLLPLGEGHVVITARAGEMRSRRTLRVMRPEPGIASANH